MKKKRGGVTCNEVTKPISTEDLAAGYAVLIKEGTKKKTYTKLDTDQQFPRQEIQSIFFSSPFSEKAELMISTQKGKNDKKEEEKQETTCYTKSRSRVKREKRKLGKEKDEKKNKEEEEETKKAANDTHSILLVLCVCAYIYLCYQGSAVRNGVEMVCFLCVPFFFYSFFFHLFTSQGPLGEPAAAAPALPPPPAATAHACVSCSSPGHPARSPPPPLPPRPLHPPRP